MYSAAFLATIPSPDQGVWHLGPIPIRAYALCIIAGIIVAIWWGERRWEARGGTKGTVLDVAVFAVPFGLVGGRLYHVVTDPELYFTEGKNPWNAFAIWDGGLGIWGAVALGAVGALIACRRRGIPLPAMADAIAPGIIVAQAIGRLGNYFNQELYGAHTDLPWGLEIYQRFDPATGAPDALGGVATGHIPLPESPVHPTFLYELIWNLLIALVVVWADRKFKLGHGRAFALYVAGYTVGRCWIELMRTDTANHILGLRVNVWTSILLFLGAMAYFVVAAKRGPREAPETLRGKEDEEDTAVESTSDDAGKKPEPEEKAAEDTVDAGSSSGENGKSEKS
ncbi:prolipoprotein diacylglyceryl transferase [Amycolatopsis echigonensis]|uniref:Phosphatidylglycerol--prolipoprotein diacylglyceryl transferase n=1 Tax=Amycolatopsis echigonensis TaxID=2576905 RepID=A0A2N3WAB6_9PSEU|nr:MULTISPECIES: prolipoprotein diacylglyceryl transferase [Amycolatopsis]MBB2505666.1 prolipoprotein diacylglyceryl transferase [Amycolatopsis echigonensis]PKV90749.1 prolipoprotein diacylglyceryl transferase [Amycolatopsis niigatensis]